MPFTPITATEYETNDWYEANADALKKINEAGELELIVFHGPWCKDCQYSIPVFNRIMTSVTNDKIKVTVADVDRATRKDAAGLCEKYDVKKVPSWVVLRGGKEIGRIIENFKDSFDEDVAAML